MDLLDAKKKILSKQSIGAVAIVLVILLNILQEFYGMPTINTASVVVAVTSSVVYVLSSYLVYFIRKNAGEECGKQEERHIEACKRHSDLLTGMRDKLSHLPSFCEEYIKTELTEARMTHLCFADINYNEYLQEYRGKKLPKSMHKYQRKAIRRANRVKPLRISKEVLIARESAGDYRRNILDPAAVRRVSNAKAIGNIFVKSVFAANVVFTFAVTGDVKTALLNALLHTIVLLWLAYSGYNDGYKFTRDVSTAYTEFKCEVLEEFKRWAPKATAEIAAPKEEMLLEQENKKEG